MTVSVGFKQPAALPEKHITDKISGGIISGKRGMIVRWTMKAGRTPACTRILTSRSRVC